MLRLPLLPGRVRGAPGRTFGHTTFANARGAYYVIEMVWAPVRRLSALLFALALVVGLAAHGVQAAHMSATMAAAAMDSPMPDGCNGCDKDGKAVPACSAICAGLVAVLPAPPTVQTVRITPRYADVSASAVGLRGPPDPFPPRSTILI